MHGLLILNKPAGASSRDAVDDVGRWFDPPQPPLRKEGRLRVGHAGTLDPAATGVLVICLGQATRLVEYVQRMPKVYRAVVRLGATSDTDDVDGRVTTVEVPHPPSEDDVLKALAAFEGRIEQVPPAHSAVFVDGQRAYRLARKGRPVNLAARRIRIDRITLVAYRFPLVEIAVECGKGTYIRALARDLGVRLGCGGLLEKLERTRIGPFRIEDAISLVAGPEEARRRLLPLQAALAEHPRLTLTPPQCLALRHGKRLMLAEPVADHDTEVAVFEAEGALVGVAGWSAAERTLRALKIFAR